MMAILKWLISGLAGGTIVAVLWVLAATHWSTVSLFGYVAVGVGILAGFTVRLSSRYDNTPPTRTQSVIAVLCTIVVTLTSFWLIASIRADQMLKVQIESQKIQGAKLSVDQLPVLMARDEAFEQTQSGQTLQWPEGQSLQSAETLDDFPTNIASQIQSEYETMTDEQRESAIAKRQELLDQLGEKFLSEIRSAMEAPEVARQLQRELFWKQLLPKNVLWIFLGCLAAYWLSSESRLPPSPTNSENVDGQPILTAHSPASPTASNPRLSGEPLSGGEDASLP